MINADFLKIGKTRGYSDYVCIDGIIHYVTFAIKKLAHDSYKTFYDTIEKANMATPEDYDNEEEMFFKTFEAATAYLISKGANLDKFESFRGSGPPI
jgi:hypothetical protein